MSGPVKYHRVGAGFIVDQRDEPLCKVEDCSPLEHPEHWVKITCQECGQSEHTAKELGGVD